MHNRERHYMRAEGISVLDFLIIKTDLRSVSESKYRGFLFINVLMCHCFPHKLLICPKAKLVTHQSIYNVYIHQVNDLLRLSYTKLVSLTGLFSLHFGS